MSVANRRAKGKWNSGENRIQTCWDRREKSEKVKQLKETQHMNYAEKPTKYVRMHYISLDFLKC